jgi:hypothetical protein
MQGKSSSVQHDGMPHPQALRRYQEGFGVRGRLFLGFSDEEQELEKRNLVIYKRFIVLLGIFLGSHVPAAAQTPAVQTPAVQIVLAHAYVVPAITMLRPVSAPLPAASFQVYQYPKKSPAYFDHVFAGAYERDDSLERLSPTEEVKTLFLTRTSLPLAQFWSGRLRLDGVIGTLNMQNVQLGPSASGGLWDFRPPRQSYPGGPRSLDLYGVSVSYHFGRGARTGSPPHLWRSLSRFVGSVLN